MALDHDYLRYYKIRTGNTILDLGATVGEFGLAFAKDIIATSSLYVAVEPSLWNLRFLTASLEASLHNNSIVISGATVEFPGPVVLYESHANVLHTTSSQVEGWNNVKYDRNTTFTGRSVVAGYTLDQLISMFGTIDFLKCDIEGAELETFLPCTQLDHISNMAVAAYHIVNDRQTHEILIPFFESKGFSTNFEEGIIYCRRV